MERSGDAVAKLGRSLRMMNLDRYFEQEPGFSGSSPVTKQEDRTLKHIQDHYKNHHQNLEDRSERFHLNFTFLLIIFNEIYKYINVFKFIFKNRVEVVTEVAK